MATVSKNFKVKNGLIVEGSTATVNGYDLLKKSSADETYITNLVGGTGTSANTADTLVKRDGSGNFSAGVITADLTGDVTGTVSSLSNHDTDDLSEGSSNQYFTDARAKSSAADLLTNANLTNITITGTGNGLTITAENGVADSDTDDLAEGTTNLYFTDFRAQMAVANALSAVGGLSYSTETLSFSVDTNVISTKTYADNAALSAESSANTYTDNAIDALDTDDIEEGSTNLYFTSGRAISAVATEISAAGGLGYGLGTGLEINRTVTDSWYDAYGAASSAEGAANSYTDTAINGLDTDDIEEGTTNKYFTDQRVIDVVDNVAGPGLTWDSTTNSLNVDTTTIATQSYVTTQISNLIDGAPGLLDTLNEIAAAINDDANYFTTVSNAIAAKQNTLTAGSNISIVSDTISVTGLDTDTVIEAAGATNLYFTNARARSAVDGTDRSFTSVAINDVAKQIAATTGNIATAAATTAYAWLKADYRSAKLTIKAKSGSHTHVSEVIVTLDTSDNIAINEYAITTSNGSLMDITADINSNDVRIRVTPANNNTEVMTVGTLIK